MKKQLVKLLILTVCMMSVSTLRANAETKRPVGTQVGEFSYVFNSSTHTATIASSDAEYDEGWDYTSSYVGTATNVVIPSSVVYEGDTYTVSAIEDNALNGSNFTSLTIPSSITSIGNYIFRACSNLKVLYCQGSSPASVNSSTFKEWELDGSVFSRAGKKNVVIPQSAYTAYSTHSVWSTIAKNWFLTNSTGDIVEAYVSSLDAIEGLTAAQLSTVTTLHVTGNFAENDVENYTTTYFPGVDNSPKDYVLTNEGTTITINKGAILSDVVSDLGTIVSDITELYITGEYLSASSINALKTKYFPNLEKVHLNLETTATSIGNYAYKDCTILASITIPNSVTSIRFEAFSGCTGLTSITIPNSVTSIVTNAFSGCTGLTSITIPNSVTFIGISTFSGCTGLTSITIPNSVTSISSYAFSGCAGLASITIPNSVTSIGSSAFYGCTGLTSITIPNSVTSIDKDAFSGCTGVTYLDCDNSSITTTITGSMKALKTVILGNNVTSIGDNAFSSCTGLTSITIPNSVTSIGNSAFSGCTGLTSVTIPNSVTSIGKDAFSGCTGVTYLDCDNSSITTTITGSMKALKTVILGNKVTSIGDNAFSSCTDLTSITIPSSVTSIGSSAFSGCRGLTSITITSSVTSISYSAFSGCTGLTSITIPSSVTSISSSIFSGCTGLTSITIPNSVTSIGSSAFYGCTGLASITIPNSVTSISNSAFSGCTGLASITIPNSVTYIYYSVFSGCTGLTSVTIPNSVTFIADNAFSGCTGVTYLDCDNSSITTAITGSMKALKTVKLGNNVTSIGNSAFENCTDLTSITIPNNVTSISSSAFVGCSSLISLDYNATNCEYAIFPSTLTNLTIGSNVESIPSYAFKDCKNLQNIVIPQSVKTIGSNAFNMSNNEDTQKITILGNNNLITLSDATAFDYGCVIYVDKDLLDNYKSAEYWTLHSSQLVAVGIKDNWNVNVSANDNMSDLHRVVGEDNLVGVVSLKVTGTINSYDLMIMRNKMPNLRNLDLENARIVSNSYEYYTGYCSVDDTWTRYAFSPNLRKLTLPNTLKTINSYAVVDAKYLKRIVIPASVEGIGAYFAQNNSSLDEVVFEDDNNLKTIGAYAFENSTISSINMNKTKITRIYDHTFYCCKNLKSLTIPSSVNEMDYNVFTGCSVLSELIIEDADVRLVTSYSSEITSNTNISYLYLGRDVLVGEDSYLYYTSAQCSLLYGVSHKIKTVGIGPKVKTLMASLFANCKNMERLDISDLNAWLNVTFLSIYSAPFNAKYSGGRIYLNGVELTDLAIPEGTTKINDYAFYGMKSLQNVTIPSSVESIGVQAFTNCRDLNLFTLPTNSKVTSIAESTFRNCTSLQKMSLPTSVQTIGANAFENCTSMTEVKIPSSITSIGDKAFYGCTALNDIYTYTLEPQAIDQNTFSTYGSATLHVPAVSYYNYYYDTQWSQFLRLVNFDEPYDYVYIQKDFYVYTETAGVISGKPRTDIEAGGGLIVEGETEQPLGDVHAYFDVTTNMGASIIGNNNLTADNLYIDIDVKKDYWHFFCFPFDVDLTKVKKDGSYVFRRYDSSMRAADGKGGWRDFNNTTLTAGRGYIFRTNLAGILSIPIANPDLSAQDASTELEEFDNDGNATPANKNWNFAGNRYLSYYNINDLSYEAPIVVWDGITYVAYRPGDDDFTLTPFQAFFVQKPAGVDEVGFDKDGRTTLIESQKAEASGSKRRAKAARLNKERKLVNLVISDGTNSDKCRVVFNNKQSEDYEAECDAAKFASMEKVATIYSLDNAGTRYAINERPVGEVNLGITIPAEGEYSISAPRMDTAVLLVDEVEGTIHDFAEGDYMFTASAGTYDKRFSLVFGNTESTAVDAIAKTQQKDESEVYDLLGRRVSKPAKGIYIVNGKKTYIK